MSTYDPLGALSADAAITGRGQDALGRRRLAEHLKNIVLRVPVGSGYVIGLVGEWGSGKSSVLKPHEGRSR